MGAKLKVEKWMSKKTFVEVVRVTEANFHDVAAWLESPSHIAVYTNDVSARFTFNIPGGRQINLNEDEYVVRYLKGGEWITEVGLRTKSLKELKKHYKPIR